MLPSTLALVTLLSYTTLNELLWLHTAWFWIFTEVVYPQRCLLVIWLVPRETAAFWAHALCTPYNPAPVYTFIRNHVPGVYVCLAVTWHFHFWQNDRDLLRVTALTRGLNGYRNESTQKVDPGEKKKLPLPWQWFVVFALLLFVIWRVYGFFVCRLCCGFFFFFLSPVQASTNGIYECSQTQSQDKANRFLVFIVPSKWIWLMLVLGF